MLNKYILMLSKICIMPNEENITCMYTLCIYIMYTEINEIFLFMYLSLFFYQIRTYMYVIHIYRHVHKAITQCYCCDAFGMCIYIIYMYVNCTCYNIIHVLFHCGNTVPISINMQILENCALSRPITTKQIPVKIRDFN